MKINILTARVAQTGLIYRTEKLIKDKKIHKFADNLAAGYDNNHFKTNHALILSSENAKNPYHIYTLLSLDALIVWNFPAKMIINLLKI